MTDYQIIVRKTSINASVEDIQSWIVDFHKWIDWSPWEGLDPELKRTYSGETSGVGAKYEWSGNKKAGAGNMAITSVRPDGIDIDLNFTRPFKSASKTKFIFANTDGVTAVEWQVHTPKTFMTRLFGLFMNFDKTVGADLEKGLAALKAKSE